MQELNATTLPGYLRRAFETRSTEEAVMAAQLLFAQTHVEVTGTTFWGDLRQACQNQNMAALEAMIKFCISGEDPAKPKTISGMDAHTAPVAELPSLDS